MGRGQQKEHSQTTAHGASGRGLCGNLMKITVTVKPGSKKGPLVEKTDDGLIVYVREPAVEGKATAVATKLLAEHFGVPKTTVRLRGGAMSRRKVFEIDESSKPRRREDT